MRGGEGSASRSLPAWSSPSRCSLMRSFSPSLFPRCAFLETLSPVEAVMEQAIPLPLVPLSLSHFSDLPTPQQ